MATKRVEIRLPGETHPVDIFAKELGTILAANGVYNHQGRPKIWKAPNRWEDEQLVPVTPQMLRTFIEQYCRPFAWVKRGRATRFKKYNRTLSADHANASSVSPQFLEQLPPLRAVNRVPLPVWHGSQLELLSPGYDPQTGILTTSEFPGGLQDEDFEESKKFLRSLLSEFCFRKQDEERAKAVALAAMLTLFCQHLFKGPFCRPGFLYSANSEGAGKTTLAYLAVVPILGHPPTGTAPGDDSEMRKLILSTVMDARSVLFLDNIKGHISFGSLEGLLTTPHYNGRILGANKVVDAENRLTVFLTANGATYSPDLRRRICAVELFLAEAKPEDHFFSAKLELENILEKRREILSAQWSLVRHWFQSGSRSAAISRMANFGSWSELILPIVADSGFQGFKAIDEASLRVSGDPITTGMETLVEMMVVGINYTFEDLCKSSAQLGILDAELDQFSQPYPRTRSRLGRLFEHFVDRTFRLEQAGKTTYRTFVRNGNHNNRKYAVRTP